MEFAITVHATYSLGITIAPVSNSYTDSKFPYMYDDIPIDVSLEKTNIFLDEIKHAISLSKPRVLFVSLDNLKKCLNALQQNQHIEQVIVYGATKLAKSFKNWKLTGFTEFFEQKLPSKESDFICEPQNVKENGAWIFMSSGTTGLPKGIYNIRYIIRIYYKFMNYIL